MTSLFPFIVLAIVIALVVRSMIGLTGLAARSGRLRPATVRILVYAPVMIFAIWVASLLWRMVAEEGGFSLWPFELAVAVAFWLTWAAVVALVVAAHDLSSRLFRRSPQADGARDA